MSTEALEKGIEAARRATEHDNSRNYFEALKLYEDAVEYLLQVIKNEREPMSEKSKDTVREKCQQYLYRAEVIKKHIFTPKKSDELPEKAIDIANYMTKRAKEEDARKNYEHAAKFYECAIEFYMQAIRTESPSRRPKIIAICKRHLDRAQKLEELLSCNTEEAEERMSIASTRSQWRFYDCLLICL